MPQSGKDSRRSDGGQPSGALQAALYATLSLQISDLVVRWTAESRESLLPLPSRGVDGREPVRDSDVASDLVRALISAIAVGDDEESNAIAAGLRFGAESCAGGISLHHTGKAVGLLVGMALNAMESAVAGSDVPPGNVADGLWLAQRLQNRATLLFLAVIRAHTQAREESLRDRFRHLRHDLRNPLGTIKSVLALMDDESIPIEARANPNFRDIAKRNARSLEDMIADQLGDAAVPLTGIANRDVSMETVASAVWRDLASTAQRHGVTVVIEASEAPAPVDAPALELLLRATLQEALRESRPGERMHLDFDLAHEGRAEMRLSSESGRTPIETRNVRDRLTALARKIGAFVTFSDQVRISVPMRTSDRGSRLTSERAVPREPLGLSVRETPHNLRSTREDDHGQASVL
jgi:signal transduction histidine kinase